MGFSRQNTGMSSLSLLQGIFPTQESNPGLPHCRQILYQLSHKESTRILQWVAYPFSSRLSWLRNQARVSCIAGGFFTNWAIREALYLPFVSLIFLNWSLVFSILLFSSISLPWSLRKAFLISPCYSLELCIFFSFCLLPLASLLFSAICKISSDNHFAFLHFFFLEMVFIMPPVQCCELLFIVLQALCLSDLGSEISI